MLPVLYRLYKVSLLARGHTTTANRHSTHSLHHVLVSHTAANSLDLLSTSRSLHTGNTTTACKRKRVNETGLPPTREDRGDRSYTASTTAKRSSASEEERKHASDDTRRNGRTFISVSAREPWSHQLSRLTRLEGAYLPRMREHLPTPPPPRPSRQLSVAVAAAGCVV